MIFYKKISCATGYTF